MSVAIAFRCRRPVLSELGIPLLQLGEEVKALANQAAMKREVYGVGMDANIITASLQALISGVNRLLSD